MVSVESVSKMGFTPRNHRELKKLGVVHSLRIEFPDLFAIHPD